MKQPKLYKPNQFMWAEEVGKSSQSFYVVFDTFSISVKWNDGGGSGRLTKFGKGKGDITEWYFSTDQYTLSKAKDFMEERALDILAKHFTRIQ